jgi:hypothetical protein
MAKRIAPKQTKEADYASAFALRATADVSLIRATSTNWGNVELQGPRERRHALTFFELFQTAREDMHKHSRGLRAPRDAWVVVPLRRGRRECRVKASPMARQQTKKAGGSHHRFSRIIRHSLRDGFNGVLRTLPGDRAFLPPSRADHLSLSISVGMPGPHDFAVRTDAARLATPARPSHPRLTFGDDWPKRPLHRGGTAAADHIFPKNGRKTFLA